MNTSSNDEERGEEELRVEMGKWKETGLSRAELSKLESIEIAGVLAALLVNYNETKYKTFAEMKNALGRRFDSTDDCGRSFVAAEDEGKEMLLKVSLSALSEVMSEAALTF